MNIDILLFVRRHANGRYLVTVPAQPDVSVFGPTLEECKDEATLALIQRLEDMDPAAVDAIAARSGQKLEQVTVELHPKRADGRKRRDAFHMQTSLVLTPTDDQIMAQAPRLQPPGSDRPLTFFVRSREELAAVAQLEIAEFFAGMPLEELPDYQGSRYEDIETITVTFKPKSPVRPTAEKGKEDEAGSKFWALKASGVNLTAQAKEGQLGRAYRREQTVQQVLAILAGERRCSLILTGDAGAGKTAIVHEVARRIQRKECPEALQDRQLWSVTGSSLVAGMMFIGQWQEKLTDLVHEVRKHRHILFVEDVAGLADAGRWSKSDENMAAFLKPYIQTGDVVILGESTPDRLRFTDRLTPGFVSQFRTVPVAPTNADDTLSILTSVVHRLEKADNVRIQPGALEAAVELTHRFLPYRALPGKAIRLLEQATADAVQARPVSDPARLPIDRPHVVASLTRQTGLPAFMLSDATPLDLGAVHGHFAARVVGQPEAVDAMTDLVAVVKSGLHDPEKPLGVFLFIGPTGVGKTQMAKTLASYLFGDEKRLLRFDMSEYMDPAGLRRLIGMPGSDNEGELTGQVRAQPFCVVLLDEFEKADPQIYDLFLQVMGEGRLTDATGRTTSFQNAIVLLTSNLGSGAREQRALGLSAGGGPEGAGEDTGYWRGKIEQYFRPEFVNRIDRIVVFQPLGPEVMRRIAGRELEQALGREGLVRRGVLAEVDDSVLDLLMDEGFTANYGARPLKRAIERLVVVPLARFLAGRSDGGGGLLRLRRQGNTVALGARPLGDDDAVVELGGAMPDASGPGKTRRIDDKGLVEGFAALRLKLQMWGERDEVTALQDERSQSLAVINKGSSRALRSGASELVGRFNHLDRLVNRLRQLTDRAEYLEELAGLVHRQRDARYRHELAESYARLERDVGFLEIELLTAGERERDRATLILRPMGTRSADDGASALLVRLAGMYGRWAMRKGYAVRMGTLEPLAITRDELIAARRKAFAELDRNRDDRALTEVALSLYPYRWALLAAGDAEGLVRELATLSGVRELAIALDGANVFGFLGSERGVHRVNEKRASGARSQTLVEVLVKKPRRPDAFLDELFDRGIRTPDAVKVLGTVSDDGGPGDGPGGDAPDGDKPPEVARVYDLSNPRQVRDPRTGARHTDVRAVFEGDLDDFILAYLRRGEG